MRFAVYSRKSVYTGKGESIENQIEMCRQYIFSKFGGAANADITVFEDEGFSAKNTERPQFQKMLREIRERNFDCIVCYRLDRISRNVSDFSSLIEDLNNRDITFICIKEEFDTSKPMGKAMMYIASVFAQLERETIAERVRDNMLMLARTGRWLGGTTPTGYSSEKVREIIMDGKAKTACRLKTDPNEIVVVKTIFDKFLELRSVSGVSKYLIGQSIKSRSGKWYSLPGIKEILQNPVYCIADKDALDYFTARNADICFEEGDCSDKLGLLTYNKRDYKKKSAPRQPVDKWIIAIGKHKGVVPGQKWAAIQDILEVNKPDGKHPAKMHNDYSLLSGLVTCGKCGSRMFAKPRSGSPELFDYICGSKLRGGTKLCGCQNLGGQQADDMVCGCLMQYTVESPDIYMLLDNLKKDLREHSPENPLTAVDARIKRLNEEMDNLISTLSQGKQTEAFVRRVNAKISELDEELTHLTTERHRLDEDAGRAADRAIRIDVLSAALSSLKNCFHEMTVHERRDLIRLLVKKIVWDGKDLHIFIDGGQ